MSKVFEDIEADREEIGSLVLRVIYEQDTEPFDPRDWDNLGVMVCGHRRYNLGDEQVSEGAADDYGSIRNWLIAEFDAIAETIMPLYLFDHSGLSMSTDASEFAAWDAHGWDWGLVGFTFATPRTIEYTGCSGDDWPPERIRESLAQEVETYDQYLRGEVFAWVIEDSEGNVLESRGGYIGDPEYAMDEARATAEFLPEYQREVVREFALTEGLGL